ncbi:MAG: nicotinate (nicotinamide) nucleotide adenylyltransferase [Lachnospiraceae bacterium]|nr:nicotinate (nicotinamide) nucleotide adenylyltransferase [Lachnospiraceae bacterium]
MAKIGILGGSFNPLHNLHIELGLSALKDYHLDKILVMPTGRPPHKMLAVGASNEDRVNMVKAVISNYDNFELDLFEMEQVEQTYTYKTLSIYKEKYSCDELFFIMGEDSLDMFPTWVNPEIICQKATMLVGQRANSDESDSFTKKLDKLSKELNGTFLPLSSPKMDISSTMIRNLIKSGEEWKHLVPKEVYSYIKEKGIYNYV